MLRMKGPALSNRLSNTYAPIHLVISGTGKFFEQCKPHWQPGKHATLFQ